MDSAIHLLYNRPWDLVKGPGGGGGGSWELPIFCIELFAGKMPKWVSMHCDWDLFGKKTMENGNESH